MLFFSVIDQLTDLFRHLGLLANLFSIEVRESLEWRRVLSRSAQWGVDLRRGKRRRRSKCLIEALGTSTTAPPRSSTPSVREKLNVINRLEFCHN